MAISRRVQRIPRAQPAAVTAEYYRAKLSALAQDKPTPRKLAKGTERHLETLEKRWHRHCTVLKVEPGAHLGDCQHKVYKTFCHWLVNTSCRLRKQSVILQYWRLLKMVYRRKFNQKVDEIVDEEYIEGPLTDEFDLDLSTRTKPVMCLDDLVRVLRFLWALDTTVFAIERERLQLSWLLKGLAYTAARLGAMIESSAYRGSNEALRYRDVDLIAVRNPEPGQPDVLLLKVRLVLNKGERNNPDGKPFIFHGREDVMGLCPIIDFIALALDDNAFEAENLKKAEDVLGVQVPSSRNSIQLKWKKSILDTPIFRRAIKRHDGVHTSKDKALTYDSVCKYIKRLGRQMGFYQNFSAYCIRRGTANALDDVATAAERNLIMGHSQARVFEKYYLTQKRDVQSAFLGCPSKDALIRSMSYMSIDQDPRAPTDLSAAQSASINNHPTIKRLEEKRVALFREIKSSHHAIKKAEGTEIHRKYNSILQELRCEKKVLRTALLEEVIDEWHDSIHTKEIERQAFIAPKPDSVIKDYSSEPATHIFEERTRIANALFTRDNTISIHEARKRLINDMTALCPLRETLKREQPVRSIEVEDDDDAPDPDLFPIVCPGTQCLFCLGDERLSHAARTFSFARRDVLQDHVLPHLRLLEQHLCSLGPYDHMVCPHPTCDATIESIGHFLNHAQLVHNTKQARDSFFSNKGGH